jgi:lysyl oxidase
MPLPRLQLIIGRSSDGVKGLAVLVAAMAVLLSSAEASSDAAPPLLPNLVTRTPAQVYLQVTPRGKHLVRLSNEVVNVGRGPLELRPRVGDCNHNGNPADDRWSWQRIYRDGDGDGRFTRGVDVHFGTRSAGCTRYHPAHRHWHFDALAEYAIRRVQSAGPILAGGTKTSSCVLDTRHRLARAAGSPRRKYYGGCRRDSVGGISIGWGDLYGARVSGQELEVTALADGVYCLVSRADPEGRLKESNERDNVRTTRIELRADRVGWPAHRPC